MRATVSVVTMLAAVAIVGCGSSHASNHGTGGVSPASGGALVRPPATPAGTPATTATTPATTAGTPATTATTPATSTAPPPSAAGTSTGPSGGAGLGPGASTATGPSGGGSTNARVPATYAIGAGGKLTPPTVSAPAFIAVEITLRSTDGKPHRVVVKTPKPHVFTVSPGHTAALLIPGQRVGNYPIVVDGTARGGLDIGGDAGP